MTRLPPQDRYRRHHRTPEPTLKPPDCLASFALLQWLWAITMETALISQRGLSDELFEDIQFIEQAQTEPLNT